MDDAKYQRIVKILLFFFFLIFPLGQLLRLELISPSASIVIQAIDIIVFLIVLRWLLKLNHLKQLVAKVYPILFILIISNLVALGSFQPLLMAKGLLYSLRLMMYLTFPLALLDGISKQQITVRFLVRGLITASLIIAVFSWVQYFLLPDLRWLYAYGWDDHLFRLTGTFLDPGFTGIILVLGSILSLKYFLQKKTFYRLFTLLFLILTLIFTYSRASYLALGVGVGYLSLKNKAHRLFLTLAPVFIICLFLLPRPASEGVKLERTSSVNTRLVNYIQTLYLWKQSPLFGVGYNQLCLAKARYLKDTDYLSHSCSGSDASLLLVLATTGITGLIIFFSSLIKGIKRIPKGSQYGDALKAMVIAVLIHGLFVNSLFYPWVMGVMGIMVAVALATSKNAG